MVDIQESWGGSELKMRIAPKAELTELPKQEVSLTTIIIGGILIWLLIFGALFSWAAFNPCSFLGFILGDEGLKGIQEKGFDTQDLDVCRAVLRGQVE